MPFALYELIRFCHVGRLRPFRTLGDLKLYLLSCTKRLKAVSRNP